MVSVAQLAEHQVVALVVVGSSPITHPTADFKGPHRPVVRTQVFRTCDGSSILPGATSRNSSDELFFFGHINYQ